MKRWTRFLGIVTSLLMVLVATGLPAQAAAKAEVDKALQATLKEQQRVEQAVPKLEPYLVRNNDGTLELDVTHKTLRKIGVAPETLNTIEGSMDAVNEAIKAGEVVSNDAGQVFFSSTGTPSITANENRVDVYWYGIRWGLSNALTQQIIGLAGMEAGATAIAAAISAAIPGAPPLAVILGVLAGALAFMNGWLTYINSQGKGVFIYTSHTGAVMWGTPH